MTAVPRQTRKQKIVGRWSLLKNERATWMDHWRDMAEHIQPRSGRFLEGDRNKGTKKNSKIINSTATRAQRIQAAGMMAGITSPARKWFKLSTHDPLLNDSPAAKAWLDALEKRYLWAFERSNIYKCLHLVYRELGTPGTAALYLEEDENDGLRGYVFPIGQYCLANSPRLQVDTLYRSLGMTVSQVVRRFTLEKCSNFVRQAWANRNLDAWVELLHAIEPNETYEEGKLGAAGKKWSSCWLEPSGEGDTVLLESGYNEFPCMCPRWETTGEDVYGSSPGMEALGDVRALQLLEKRAAQAFDKVVKPPMRAPMELQHLQASLVPGDITYTPSNGAGQKFEPAMEINPQALQAFEAKIASHERRINQAFMADLWLMFAQENNNMTATEVVERQSEKLLQLGPVMETIDDELLDPLMRRTFSILQAQGLVPPPPKELQGMELRVEYTSIMAQAQKLLGTTAIERLTSFVGNIVAVKPDVMDKIDTDQLIDEYSVMLSVPPSVVRSDEAVAALRQQRAQQMQQQQQMQQSEVMTQGAKTLSQTDTGGDNALTRMLGSMGIPSAPR